MPFSCITIVELEQILVLILGNIQST